MILYGDKGTGKTYFIKEFLYRAFIQGFFKKGMYYENLENFHQKMALDYIESNLSKVE